MDILDNEQSNFIAKLFSKLNKARKEFKPVYKSGTYVSKKSGHRYNYAQLSDYLEAIENGINGNNLYIMQPIIENKLLTQIVDCETGFIYTLTTIDLMKSTNEYSTDIAFQFLLKRLFGQHNKRF